MDRQRTSGENIIEDIGRQYDASNQDWNLDYVHIIGMYSLYNGYIIRLADTNGVVVWDAENHDMTLCGQIMGEISERMEKFGGGFIARSYDVNQSGRKVGTVSITYYGPYFLNEDDFTFLSAMNVVLLAAGVLASASAVLIGFPLARRIARPVAKAAYIAKRISKGDYDIRFESETKTRELNDLVAAVNHLAAALSEQESLRKRLTTNMAHELRTPLTAVSSHLEAMIDGIWDVTTERLRGCHNEIKRLGAMVADMERLSKIEGENLKLNESTVDLFAIARAVADNMSAETVKKNLSLTVEGGSVFVKADGDKINQVFNNLLSNAIKYTPEGGHIEIEVRDALNSGVFKVRDNGIGIPSDELPLVFERFYRTDKSRSRKSGGVGIGLAIVKSIVTAHGGSVSAESVSERGSCFTVSIPK
jgi:signal transduction histidine kinase